MLDEHRRKVETQQQSADDDDQNEDKEVELELTPPSEDTRMRLTRLFTPSLTVALEALYPRLTSASSWAHENAPESSVLALPHMQSSPSKSNPSGSGAGKRPAAGGLPRMSKFILVAAFLASTNPAKTDLKMFGRGLDERKKKRKGGGPRKVGGKSTVAKVSPKLRAHLIHSTADHFAQVPQRLLGPATFPIDRLIAILGVLLEENDVELRPHAPQFTIPGEYTDMEIGRVQVYAAVIISLILASHRRC